MTRAKFDTLSDEEAFLLCCPGIVDNKFDEKKFEDEFEIEDCAYQL